MYILSAQSPVHRQFIAMRAFADVVATLDDSQPHGSIVDESMLATLEGLIDAAHHESPVDEDVAPTSPADDPGSASGIAPVIHCATTEIDSDSVTVLESTPTRSRSMTPPPPPSTDDTLLDTLVRHYDLPTPEKSSSSLDSQATENEDPMATDILSPPPLPHWSMEDAFWRDCCHFLDALKHEYFYHGLLEYVASASSRPLNFDIGVQTAANFIRSEVQSRRTYYKIGITGHPMQRWYREDCGYFKDEHGFTKMTIVWVSHCSRKELADSTGRMETELVKLFDRDQDSCCINRPKSGGESPPRGSPQFCYVVWS